MGSSLHENVLFWDEFSLYCVIPEVTFQYGKPEQNNSLMEYGKNTPPGFLVSFSCQ